MRSQSTTKGSAAYSRVDLIFAIAAIAMLGTVSLSVLASSAVRNDTAVCANNLRQVGRAFHMWASDHGGENPWWTSYNDGGSYVRRGGPTPSQINVPGIGPLPAGLRNNTWFHFGFISQELSTPAVLLCPTDRTKFRAGEFSNVPGKGYYSFGFQNGATSYFIGAHALSTAPSALLSGDRTLKEDGIGPCPVNVGELSRIFLNGLPKSWDMDLHPATGNLLLNDGRVEEFSSDGLTRFLDPRGGYGGESDFIKPR